MSRPAIIPRADLAFAYELWHALLTWEQIEVHTGFKKSTIIKSLKRAGA